MSRLQKNTEGGAAASQHKKTKRTSKLPSDKKILLVLGSLLATALVVICRLAVAVRMTNQIVQTLNEEKKALGRNVPAINPNRTMQATCPPPVIKNEICLKCEAGWALHRGTCYYFNTNESSWTESRLFCRDLGGDLVKIDSREEQMFLETRLRGKMKNESNMFWIGLTDLEGKDQWFWMDESPLVESLSFWSENQPGGNKTAREEDFVKKGKKTEAGDLKSWFKRSCHESHRNICEKAAEMSPCYCL